MNYFDVIILDINMPIMDGFEACERIMKFLYNDTNEAESKESSL